MQLSGGASAIIRPRQDTGAPIVGAHETLAVWIRMRPEEDIEMPIGTKATCGYIKEALVNGRLYYWRNKGCVWPGVVSIELEMDTSIKGRRHGILRESNTILASVAIVVSSFPRVFASIPK